MIEIRKYNKIIYHYQISLLLILGIYMFTDYYTKSIKVKAGNNITDLTSSYYSSVIT